MSGARQVQVAKGKAYIVEVRGAARRHDDRVRVREQPGGVGAPRYLDNTPSSSSIDKRSTSTPSKASIPDRARPGVAENGMGDRKSTVDRSTPGPRSGRAQFDHHVERPHAWMTLCRLRQGSPLLRGSRQTVQLEARMGLQGREAGIGGLADRLVGEDDRPMPALAATASWCAVATVIAQAPSAIWSANKAGAMVVLPCGASARPFRSRKARIHRRFISRMSARSTASGNGQSPRRTFQPCSAMRCNGKGVTPAGIPLMVGSSTRSSPKMAWPCRTVMRSGRAGRSGRRSFL